LNDFVATWDMHTIRSSKNQNCPHGKPSALYRAPCVFQAHECLMPIDEVEVQCCSEECVSKSEIVGDVDLVDLMCLLVHENSWSLPTDGSSGNALYINLRMLLRPMLGLP
jgi:hypothetical protein